MTVRQCAEKQDQQEQQKLVSRPTYDHCVNFEDGEED